MQVHHNYRPLSLALCIALTLCSIGLPVIVVACGMGSAVVTKTCGTSASHSEGHTITRQPCQARVFFFERNTTAYLPAKTEARPFVLQAMFVLPSQPLNRLEHVGVVKPEASPPFVRDIPLLISSLLI